MSSTDPDFAQAALDFKRGGWIVSLLGVVGALIRLLLDERRHHWVVWAKRAVAGGLVGVVCYFALHGTRIDPLYKSVILSTSGALAPHWFQLIENKIRKLLIRKK